MTALIVRGDAPTRPALRWFGGKWRLAPWIIQHLPPHDAYVEPYGGAASVLLRKPPAKLETWNDLHGRLVNFFTMLRERPDELVGALELTPYARAEYEQAREPSPDPLEDARRLFISCWQGRIGGSHGGRGHGWRYSVDIDLRKGCSPAADLIPAVDGLHAVAERLRPVQIEHAPALTIIERYDRPKVLHYVDPPYWDPNADLHSRYAHSLTEADHRELAEALHAARGMVVLSGRPSALYDDLYGDWVQAQRESLTDSGRLGTEALWFNPAAAAALQRGQPHQGSLL